eukprot:jgi/Chrzof1/10742/Cz05g10220.t1
MGLQLGTGDIARISFDGLQHQRFHHALGALMARSIRGYLCNKIWKLLSAMGLQLGAGDLARIRSADGLKHQRLLMQQDPEAAECHGATAWDW